MEIDLGTWGHGDRKGTGLLGEIEDKLRNHALRLNLAENVKRQLSVAVPILLEAFGFQKPDKGTVWHNDGPELEPGMLVEGMAETLSDRVEKLEEYLAMKPDVDIERHEQRLLAVEASLAKLAEPDRSELDSLRAQVATLSVKVAELSTQKGRTKKE